MKFSVPAFLALSLLSSTTTASYTSHVLHTRSLLPRAPLSETLEYALRLDEQDPLVRDLADHISIVARSINQKRLALPIAWAEAAAQPGKGASAGAKAVKTQSKNGSGGSGGGTAAPPPGLSESGKKALDDCNKAQSKQGDCSATKGPFAEMGCNLGSIHSMKPCENKDLQSALKKNYCSTPAGKSWKHCK